MSKIPKISVIGLCGRSVFMTVDHFHAEGETVHADSIHIEPGGKGYNQAVAAARLGAEVSFIACCGNDDDAAACEKFLIEERIRPCFERSVVSATAFATILTDRDGRNRVTVYSGATQEMSCDFIFANSDLISDSNILLLNCEYPIEINLAALEIAKKSGTFTILNPAPAGMIDPDILKCFDLTTPNQNEVLSYSGLSAETAPEEIAAALKKNGYQNVVVTLGENGVLTVSGNTARLYQAIKCKAVDTTGAGDAFNGALAVAIAEGKSLEDAVIFAQNVASLSIRKPYVMPSLPTRKDAISSFINIDPIIL